MMDAPLNAEVESLIQGYMDGELTASECTRLLELLETSAGLVTPILVSLRTDALIRQVLSSTTPMEFEQPTCPGMARGEDAAGRSLEPRRYARVAFGIAVAACLVALLALGWKYFGTHPSPQSVVSPVRGIETGTILYEFWAGIPGATVVEFTSHPSFQSAPTSREFLASFEAPSGRDQDYGARVRGYLNPPVTGEYLFWIAADDAGELWLSEDENPSNKRRICFVDTWTPPREWTLRASQRSPYIVLHAGRRYYMEVLHKQGNGGDSLAVAWQAPGGTRETIPGHVLTPFAESNPSAAP